MHLNHVCAIEDNYKMQGNGPLVVMDVNIQILLPNYKHQGGQRDWKTKSSPNELNEVPTFLKAPEKRKNFSYDNFTTVARLS